MSIGNRGLKAYNRGKHQPLSKTCSLLMSSVHLTAGKYTQCVVRRQESPPECDMVLGRRQHLAHGDPDE